MDTMRKPWVYKRTGIKGWWCGWYEGGKRKAKALPSKALAEHFRNMKYAQLNSDVFTGVVDFAWSQIVEEYRRAKQVEGLREASIYETRLTLRHFERLVGPCSSRQITQQVLDKFILERGKEVGKNTLNKDIRNIGAFLNWAIKDRYAASGLAWIPTLLLRANTTGPGGWRGGSRLVAVRRPIRAIRRQAEDACCPARGWPLRSCPGRRPATAGCGHAWQN